MKKILSFMIAIIVIICCAETASAQQNTNSITSDICGTWLDDNGEYGATYWKFREDGTGYADVYSSGNDISGQIYSFNWRIKDSTLTLKLDTLYQENYGKDTLIFEDVNISEGKYLNWTSGWSKVKMERYQ